MESHYSSELIKFTFGIGSSWPFITSNIVHSKGMTTYISRLMDSSEQF